MTDQTKGVMQLTLREERERLEHQILSPLASFADESRGRLRDITPCDMRTCYQRDIDRIVHSKAFRRLKHKTQVFLQPEGDHYRTRMTHTLEVCRIARTITRALRLNEDLTEAIALGHDLGHTPFGHAGEKALSALLPGGFRHNEQSLRVVDLLEHDGAGLNLTYEVRMGILLHTTGVEQPDTLEGQIVRLSDRIAYINHDIDDAVRAGVLREDDIPKDIARKLGDSHGRRIDTLVRDVITSSAETGGITMTPGIADAMETLHAFMFERVYRNPAAKSEESKAPAILSMLFDYYVKNPETLPPPVEEGESTERRAADYIAGMTDTYAVYKFQELFVPQGWQDR